MHYPAAAERPTVIVGVAGGIAAFKALELVRLLSESGCNVHVIPTLSALRFIGEASFAALSGNPVHTDVWSDVHDVPHVSLARSAEAIVVVPATADLMARAAVGRADDLLTATMLTATCPVILSPAMHTEMWDNAATVANVETLRSRGIVVLEPAVGRLTGVDSGKGRLPDPVAIAAVVRHALRAGRTAPDMVGKRVVVTAGGTREALDPVRFLGNRSSGRQGYALAAVAAARGARVTLISANSSLPDPAGVDIVRVTSTADMQAALAAHASDADAIVMAAAVSDFRPDEAAGHKIKKSGDEALELRLIQNPDLLAGLVAQRRQGQVIVGFAAETGDSHVDAIEYGRQKLLRKGCDLLVINDVSADKAFEVDDNAVTIISADSEPVEVQLSNKELVAETVWHLVISRF
jgi:phosphopantothenoylcysteine decarboxylase/phosphopantothenate--cysteine ligase